MIRDKTIIRADSMASPFLAATRRAATIGVLAALALAPGTGVADGARATQDVLAAYIGPGAGLAAIGALLAVGWLMFTTVVGLVWYPFRQARRWWNARRERSAGLDDEQDEGGASSAAD